MILKAIPTSCATLVRMRPARERQRLAEALGRWGLRVCRSASRAPRTKIIATRGRSERRGILIGVWDERELPAELWSNYRGSKDRGAADKT